MRKFGRQWSTNARVLTTICPDFVSESGRYHTIIADGSEISKLVLPPRQVPIIGLVAKWRDLRTVGYEMQNTAG